MGHAIRQVRKLCSEGAEMYCWSSGGSDYAKESAKELGIEECFVGFLPKPQVILDDQNFSDWKYLTYLHPNNAGERTITELNPFSRL